MKTHSRTRVTILAALTTLAAVAWQTPAVADPPSWAPAYGAREHDEDRSEDRRDERRDDRRDDRREDHHEDREHEYVRYDGHDDWHGDRHGYHGYYGDDWHDDYGVVRSGHCNTDVLLGVTGAVGGAVIGNRTSTPENRDIATIFGAIAGGIIGTAVGGAIDNGDRACIGHSLELAPVGHPVYWSNPRSHVGWRVVPLRDLSPVCREFHVYREFAGHHDVERVVACRRNRGAWDIRS
jgi:surface antigen